MARVYGSSLVAAALLALAAPAYAGNADAPGLLKKQQPSSDTTTATPAPAPTAVPQAQAPAAPKKVSANAKAPVTKGTVKRLARKQVTTAPTTPTVRRSARRAQRAGPRRASHPRAAVHRHAQRAGSAANAGRATAGSNGSAATTKPPAASHRARHAAASAQPKPAIRVAADRNTAEAPLTSLSHAADRVIEVIPGAVVLALAGLTGLVLLLVGRSLMIERQRGKALARSYGVTVEALATAIEAKDHTTGGHIERVRKLGLLLATEMVPREARDPQMAYGFLLHDIGKLAVPDAILRAPGRLGEDEWALMRRHPEEGVRMLSGVPFLDRALDVVRYHHERWDGGGYPDGLRGEEIPLWARIFSVVDALDAMTAERPYRAARSYESALEEIRRHSGTQFDPDVVRALEGIDPATVEPLLEPTQQIAPEAAPVADLGPLVPA